MTDHRDLRYNEVQQKSIHNAFQRDEGIVDQFLYWRIRSMEVDVHHGDIFGNSTPGDWAVYHDWHDPISSVARLSQFLDTCRGLNRLVPRHEVTTLFVDIKDPFPKRASARHGWKAFDQLLDKHLGPRLFRPADLLKRSPGEASLRAALAHAGWPTLAELRGKFIVVLTGSTAQLANYASGPSAAGDRAAFLSAPVDGPGDIPGAGDEVFFNINGETDVDLVERVHPLGYIARAYYLNSWPLWRKATGRRCHHLATDKVNERLDRWARTRNGDGFPFRGIDRKAIDATESGDLGGVWARSGDIWSNADSFVFNFRRHQPSPVPASYDLTIASPNSHTAEFTKGVVMARAGLEADAAYFAVVRTGHKHGLRVQFRPERGAPTVATGPQIGPRGLFGHDIDQDTIAHTRLTVGRDGRRVKAWGSFDRREWVRLGEFEFRSPLTYHGVGVSSHGQQRGSKFMFVPAGRGDHPVFDRQATIGAGASGWSDWSRTDRWLTDRFVQQ